MRYFHIQRINGIRKEWDFGEYGTTERAEFNDFFKGIVEGIERNSIPQTNGNKLIQHSREILSKQWLSELDYESQNYKELFFKSQDLCSSFNHLAHQLFESHVQYLKWIREQIFENNRIQINPELPSRKKCLWLSNKNGLENWWNTLSDSQNRKIIELELEKKGKIHIADAQFLNLDAYNINEFNKVSIDYWNGIKNNETDIEILYEGQFKVIGEYNNLEQI
ncbi:DUF2441 domain-containing protein [Algibacter sp. L4_22]|uniref:DUF2441 domain-containing protein n=1 Tax=Algibacter sp. L4_22 TaxID=2942477 RepID=UPI00201B8467|nr:DUF2441 domain-containing protein [Algibacter sp. L4_22]MCL5130589.1 DUF2441 domain-containing protein [Algibacter sp. L4_22]